MATEITHWRQHYAGSGSEFRITWLVSETGAPLTLFPGVTIGAQKFLAAFAAHFEPPIPMIPNFTIKQTAYDLRQGDFHKIYWLIEGRNSGPIGDWFNNSYVLLRDPFYGAMFQVAKVEQVSGEPAEPPDPSGGITGAIEAATEKATDVFGWLAWVVPLAIVAIIIFSLSKVVD